MFKVLITLSILLNICSVRVLCQNSIGRPIIEQFYPGGGQCGCNGNLPYSIDTPQLDNQQFANDLEYNYVIEHPKQQEPESELQYKLDFTIEKPAEHVKLEESYGYAVKSPQTDFKLENIEFKVDIPLPKINADVVQEFVATIDKIISPRKYLLNTNCGCNNQMKFDSPIYDRKPNMVTPESSIYFQLPAAHYENRYTLDTDIINENIIKQRSKRSTNTTSKKPKKSKNFIKRLNKSSKKPKSKKLKSIFDFLFKNFRAKEHKIRKRSTTDDHQSNHEQIITDADEEQFQLRLKLQNQLNELRKIHQEQSLQLNNCKSIENLRMHGNPDVFRRPDVIQYLPEVNNYGYSQQPSPPLQPMIGSSLPATKFSLPHYYELRNSGEPIAYQLGGSSIITDEPTLAQSFPSTFDPNHRIVYDRYGHKYIEKNGNLMLVRPTSLEDPIVGLNYFNKNQPPPPPQYYHMLHDILDKNHGFMYKANRLGPNRLVDHPLSIIKDDIRLLDDMINSYKAQKKHQNHHHEDGEYHDDNSNYKLVHSDHWVGDAHTNNDLDDNEIAETIVNNKNSLLLENQQNLYKFEQIGYNHIDGSTIIKIQPTMSNAKNSLQSSDSHTALDDLGSISEVFDLLSGAKYTIDNTNNESAIIVNDNLSDSTEITNDNRGLAAHFNQEHKRIK